MPGHQTPIFWRDPRVLWDTVSVNTHTMLPGVGVPGLRNGKRVGIVCASPVAFDCPNFINARSKRAAVGCGFAARTRRSPSPVLQSPAAAAGGVWAGGGDPHGDLLSAGMRSRRELEPSPGPSRRALLCTQRVERRWCKGWVFAKRLLGLYVGDVGLLEPPWAIWG